MTDVKTLPNKLIPMPNRDKQFHETWYPERNLLDFPHPFRMLLASKPNGGKTTAIKNIVLRVALGKKPFQKIIICHCDPDNTREYNDLDHEMVHEIPAIESLDTSKKTLIILEDLNYLDMSQEQKGRLERLYGYASTHKNLSCVLTSQDPFRVLPTVRRCTNVWILWNNHDAQMTKSLAKRLGISSEKLVQLFQQECKNPHDSLWMDFTTGSPAPIRKNGYEVFSM